jgi:branched-chain amino acid transport system substrate-binding protein
VTRRTNGGRAGAIGHLVPIALAALAAPSCDNLSPQVSGISANDRGAGPIVIGHYASLTGSEATFGESDKNGLTLAIEERNARGGVHGRPIEVIRLDDASKAAEAGTAVTRLITEYHVVAIVG